MVAVRWVLVLTAVLVLACSAPASAIPPKRCQSVKVGGTKHTVIVHGRSCAFARRWVGRYLRAKRSPRGYKCRGGRGTNVRVNCQGRTKPPDDPVVRYFYGIKS